MPGPARNTVIPLGVADIKREGTDISLIAHGRSVAHRARRPPKSSPPNTASTPRSSTSARIRPLDEDAILASVRKTHRAVCVDENKPFCGVGAQIAAMIQEKGLRRSRRPGPARLLARRPRDLLARSSKPKQLPRPTDVVEKVLSIC